MRTGTPSCAVVCLTSRVGRARSGHRCQRRVCWAAVPWARRGASGKEVRWQGEAAAQLRAATSLTLRTASMLSKGQRERTASYFRRHMQMCSKIHRWGYIERLRHATDVHIYVITFSQRQECAA